MLQERLQASPIHARQVSTETFPTGGIHRRIKVGPLVSASHRVGRAKSHRTIASPMPVDQSKARFVEGQDLQRLVLLLLLLLLVVVVVVVVVLRFALPELLP